MKIYDFETFKKNCKNVKAIKYKEAQEIPIRYNKEYFAWGKKFDATFISEDIYNFIDINICLGDFKRKEAIFFNYFDDVIEYVEINSELEIE